MTDRKHIEQLAAKLGVEISWTAARFRAAVNRLTLIAYLTPLQGDEDDENYWVALHELGHIASPQAGRPFRTREEIVADEANAWRWAIDNSRRPLTDAARIEIGGGLGSYWRRGYNPEGYGADVVLAILEDLGEIELPWPKTNAAFQAGRAAYLAARLATA